ncbi:MAG: Hsp20/alpha crystallin family protein [Chloroflexota bacterium]
MPVRYQRLTYRYWQGRHQPAPVSFERAWLAGIQAVTASGLRRPPVDVWETREALVVKTVLPGVPEDEIRVLLYEDVLIISGQRQDPSEEDERRFHRAEIHYGPLQVEVPLPVSVEAEQVQASYDRGMLTVHLPKRRNEVRPA